MSHSQLIQTSRATLHPESSSREEENTVIGQTSLCPITERRLGVSCGPQKPLNPPQKEFNVSDVPAAALGGCWNLTSVEHVHKIPDAGASLGSKLFDDRHHRQGKGIGLSSTPSVDGFEIRIPKFDAFGLGCRKPFFRAFADAVPLELGKHGQHLDHHLVRVWIVTTDEIHPALDQAGDEVDVAGKAVELGDQERYAAPATLLDGGLKLGPVVLLSGFDLGILVGQVAAVCFEVALDGCALRVEAVAAGSLFLGRNAIIGDIEAI